MHRTRRTAAAVALALMLHVTLAESVHAATRNWAAAVSGFAGTAANWNPAVVPTTLDSCVYNFNAGYDVSFANLVPSVAAQIVTSGGVGLIIDSPHTIRDEVIVGRTAGVPCSLIVRTGAATATGEFHVGTVNGTTGVLRVSGENSVVNGVATTGATAIGGNGGTGRLVVEDGALVLLTNELDIGQHGGHGTVRVNGTGDSDSTRRSTLVTTVSSPFATVLGAYDANGRLEVTNGGQALLSRTVFLSPFAADTSSLYVGGESTRDSARVVISSTLHVSDPPVAPGPAGTSTVTVAPGGVLDVLGDTRLGDPADGSQAELTIRGGGRMITRGLRLKDPASQLRFTGGRLQIRGGLLETNGRALDLSSTLGTPRLDLISGALAELSSSTAPTLRVGRTGSAQMRVLGGSTLHVSSHNAIVGDSAGANGTLVVADFPSSLTVDEVLLVGRAGTGSFEVRDEGRAVVDQLGISTQATGVGTVTVSGPGSELSVNTDLQLAGLASGASGATGTLTVEDEGLLQLGGFPSSGTVWDDGLFTLTNGGRATFPGTLSLQGQIVLNGGSLEGPLLSMRGRGVLSGVGDVHAAVLTPFDTTAWILLPLQASSLGHEAFPLGFAFGGLLTVGPAHVTLRDADSAAVGTVEMVGGTLTAPPGGMFLPAGRRLFGNGTIEGTFRPSGYVLASGVGLSFSGAVLRSGQGMNGSKFRFLPGGSFLGRGRIEATVQVDSGAVMAPTGDVTLGNALAASSVTIDGLGLVGPGIEWDLDGTDTTRVNGLLQLARGFVFPNLAPLFVRTAGRLAGNGDVTGGTIVAGALDPGVANRTGRLGFAQLRLRNSSLTTFDVGAFASGDLDTLTATVNAALGGRLDFRLGAGFAPAIGDSFLVLSAPTVSGTFTSVTIGGGLATGWIQLRYRPNAVWAHVVGAGLDATPATTPHALRFAALGSPSRTLAFTLELPRDADAAIELFDVSGRRLGTLHRGPLAAGVHRMVAAEAIAPEGGLLFARAVLRDGQGITVRTARAVKLR